MLNSFLMDEWMNSQKKFTFCEQKFVLVQFLLCVAATLVSEAVETFLLKIAFSNLICYKPQGR